MTTYPASYVKTRCIEYDPITVKFLLDQGFKLDSRILENRDGTLEKIYG